MPIESPIRSPIESKESSAGKDQTQSSVLSPVTQALSEGTLSRAELKSLMVRTNKPVLVSLILWVLTLYVSASLIYFAKDSFWLLPAMTVHGIVLVHHFSLQHECCHYTPFKTRWLNDVVGNLCGLVIMLPNRFFRYEHCDHHTHTQLTGLDPEMIEMPKSLSAYFWYLSSIPYWQTKLSELYRHAAGQLNTTEKRFVPKSQYEIIYWEARLMLGFYLFIFAYSVIAGWWTPLWYWLLPVILGEPFMRAIRMTEHVGRPATKLMRENTRTTLVSLPLRFLCWNMNYHAEHHYASSVPFHALPRLHEKIKKTIHVERGGYLGAHLDIISQLSGVNKPGPIS